MRDTIDLGEQFAILKDQIENAHSFAVKGQRPGLPQDEACKLVQLLQRELAGMAQTCVRIIAA